jgi:SAM-dependent methyltransferase
MSRQELRKTFGEDARLYDRVRPSYPTALYDDLAALVQPVRPRVLEIGCGTGQATAPLVARGWPVTAVELSADLASLARRKLPEVEVVTAAFEEWPLPADKFDLVLSATAFHWIDPEVRVVKSADALRRDGVLAVVSTHHVAGGNQEFFDQVQHCYERFMPGTIPGLRMLTAEAVPEDSAEIDGSGRFEKAEFRRYEWEKEYTTAEYLDLLSSYSGHRALAPDARAALYACIAGLIDGLGGRIAKRYLTLLTAARVLG